MKARGFELLIGAVLLGSLTMHYYYEDVVLVYQHEQRQSEWRATFKRWRALARDEQRLQQLYDETLTLREQVEELTTIERKSADRVERILEQWLRRRGVWREA